MKLGEWRPKAECLGEDTDFFYIDERSSNQPAMAVCSRCEVRAQCLIEAIENKERWGIFGGMLPHERAKVDKAVTHLPRDLSRQIIYDISQTTPLQRWGKNVRDNNRNSTNQSDLRGQP
jgi:WhiB family redox-sensing transcriptional regulator